jgi:predicted ATPase
MNLSLAEFNSLDWGDSRKHLGALSPAGLREFQATPHDRWDWQVQEEIKRHDYFLKWVRNNLPAGLRLTDESLHPNLAEHRQVMSWIPNVKGLLLVGPTGGGKTRSLVAWAENYILSQKFSGSPISFQSAPRLGDKISSLAYSDPKSFDDFIERLEKASVLAVDDLGAQKITERVAASLHRIIDTRYSRNLPLLVSTNANPPTLQRTLLDFEGRTMRRLMERLDVIRFDQVDLSYLEIQPQRHKELGPLGPPLRARA